MNKEFQDESHTQLKLPRYFTENIVSDGFLNENVPPEVQYLIINRLSSQDLEQGIFVSKKWQDFVVTYPYKYLGTHILGHTLPFLFYPKTHSLSIHSLSLVDEDLKHFSCLPNLVELDIGFCPYIKGNGFTYISLLTSLNKLKMSGNNFDDEGLNSLSSLHQLKTVEMYSSLYITDAGIQYLSSLSNLEKLYLLYCPGITDKGIKSLSPLSHLKVRITDYKKAPQALSIALNDRNWGLWRRQRSSETNFYVLRPSSEEGDDPLIPKDLRNTQSIKLKIVNKTLHNFYFSSFSLSNFDLSEEELFHEKYLDPYSRSYTIYPGTFFLLQGLDRHSPPCTLEWNFGKDIPVINTTFTPFSKKKTYSVFSSSQFTFLTVDGYIGKLLGDNSLLLENESLMNKLFLCLDLPDDEQPVFVYHELYNPLKK